LRKPHAPSLSLYLNLYYKFPHPYLRGHFGREEREPRPARDKVGRRDRKLALDRVDDLGLEHVGAVGELLAVAVLRELGDLQGTGAVPEIYTYKYESRVRPR
jgi:hypothetical protein